MVGGERAGEHVGYAVQIRPRLDGGTTQRRAQRRSSSARAASMADRDCFSAERGRPGEVGGGAGSGGEHQRGERQREEGRVTGAMCRGRATGAMRMDEGDGAAVDK
jgi:hypothetical protein